MTTQEAEKSEHEDTVEKYGALIKGLETENPDRISSAAYVCARLDGLPKLDDDFEFNRGHGISSEALLYSLSFLLPESNAKDYDEYEDYVKKGEILSEFDDVVDLSFYLYNQENEDREKTRAWKRILSELEENSDEFEREIEELREKIAGG